MLVVDQCLEAAQKRLLIVSMRLTRGTCANECFQYLAYAIVAAPFVGPR